MTARVLREAIHEVAELGVDCGRDLFGVRIVACRNRRCDPCKFRLHPIKCGGWAHRRRRPPADGVAESVAAYGERRSA